MKKFLPLLLILIFSIRFSLGEDQSDFDYIKIGTDAVMLTEYSGNKPDIIIPEEIYSLRILMIGEAAFSQSSVVNVTIPGCIIRIDDSAFQGCKSLTSVTISDGVQSIGNEAFKSCTSLASVIIPASVTELGDDIFDDSPSVILTVDNGSYANKYADEHGIGFYIAETEKQTNNSSGRIENKICDDFEYICSGDSALITRYTGRDDILEIPYMLDDYIVEAICADAFANSTLTAVSIPVGVQKIEPFAFQDCNRLETVYITGSSTSVEAFAFDTCRMLASVFIPDNTECIAAGAFFGCPSVNLFVYESVHYNIDFTNLPVVKDVYNAKVFYTDGGTYYHLTEHCNGMMGATSHSLTDAIQAGKIGCETCNSGCLIQYGNYLWIDSGKKAHTTDECLFFRSGLYSVLSLEAIKQSNFALCSICQSDNYFRYITESYTHECKPGEITCEQAQRCVECGKELGKPLGHDWQTATYETPETCSRCGTTKGEKLTLVGFKAYDVAKGKTVYFGHYPQTISGMDNSPIEWLVLERLDNKALLISKDILEQYTYNFNKADVRWATCTLRDWLNSEFLNRAFTEIEQQSICKSTVSNGQLIGSYYVRNGKDTYDRIFLLSYEEAEKYFSNKTERICVRSQWMSHNGAEEIWWLRTQGENYSQACLVDGAGELYCQATVNCTFSVRPAIWVKIYW